MSDINNPTSASLARSPRGAVKVNGAIITGWVDWEVDNNAYRAADTFRVTFSISGLPAGKGMDWFASLVSASCEIFANEAPADPAGYTPIAADRLILGQVDDITFDPVAGTLELTGRDYTAKLIDTKTSENFQEKTASAIATILAGRHGLTPVVTATTTKVGHFYAQEHVSLTQERSEWDILAQLAQFENFDAFVSGNELHFQPKASDAGQRYAIQWTPPANAVAFPQANAIDLRLSRSLTIAKGVVVKVSSWHAKHGKSYTASWPRAAKGAKPGTSGEAAPLVYSYHLPLKTRDECQREAQRRYDAIVQHMMKLTAELPGDGLLDCAKVVQVRGTGSAWDQDYYPDSVRRSMSIDEGYRMTLSAKNVSADYSAEN